MENIFHEKQEGSLCAQHCLNALLQGPYFTPVDLATLAQRMDDEERLRMAESGVDTEEYRRFIEQPSGNMDDSGYFSVQVISSALEVWGLELVPFNSSDMLSKEAHSHPEKMSAYICNYRDHWFTIRKLGYQWFNLNSLMSRPELISDTYLSIFLAQLQEEGYSIFIVHGRLPDCTADELLKVTPAVQIKSSVKKEAPQSPQDFEVQKAIKMSLGEDVDKDEEDLQAAIELSLKEESQDPSLDKAIQLSLQLNSSEDSAGVAMCSHGSPRTICSSLKPSGKKQEVEEDDDLEGAIRLSLECHEPSHQPRVVNIPITVEGREPCQRPLNIPINSPDAVDPAEIRRKRLAYIESKAASGR